MNILRAIIAGLLGYLVFAFGSMLLVGLIVSNSTIVGAVIAIIGLPVIGFAAGKVISVVDANHGSMNGYIVSVLVLLATIVNIVQSLGAEPLWYKIATILLVIPAILIAARDNSNRRESLADSAE